MRRLITPLLAVLTAAALLGAGDAKNATDAKATAATKAAPKAAATTAAPAKPAAAPAAPAKPAAPQPVPLTITPTAIPVAPPGGAAPAPAGPCGVAEVKERSFDAGKVERGGNITHAFVIKNVGKNDLTVDAKPG